MEYLKDLNATAAYKRTYPRAAQKSAEVGGCELLRNIKVDAEIKRIQKERFERSNLTAEKVLKAYARLVNADVREFVEWDEKGQCLRFKASKDLTEDQGACIQEIQWDGKHVKLKLRPNQQALQDMAKHFKLLTERLELQGQDGKPIKMEIRTMTVVEPEKNGQP